MRSSLKTVRLRPKENEWVEQFLKQNLWIESFSELARIAVLDFIQKRGEIPIRPITTRKNKKKLSFLWDYDLDSEDVKTILNEQPLTKKHWLVARILEHAPFEEVWNYLTLSEIVEALPKLRMNEKRKKHWEFAIREWASK